MSRERRREVQRKRQTEHEGGRRQKTMLQSEQAGGEGDILPENQQLLKLQFQAHRCRKSQITELERLLVLPGRQVVGLEWNCVAEIVCDEVGMQSEEAG